MIVADSREPEEYKKLADKVADTGIDFLVVGDKKKFCIERKTISDLLHSLRGEGRKTSKGVRLWEQLEILSKMREQGFIPFLIVEGNLWQAMKLGYMKIPQWLGIQLSVASFGVSFMSVTGKNQFKYVLKMMNERAGESKEFVKPSIPKPKARTIEEEREDMFSAVSGIGHKKAKEIVEEFGTVKNVCDAGDKIISLLGEKVGKHLLEVLNG